MAFGLFKKKKKEKANDSRYISLTIKEVRPVAKDAVNLIFKKPENGFSYEPGQFITLIQNVEGKKIRRAYSLCTSPFETDEPAVTVKRVKDGAMSNYINDTFQAGMEVEVMEPMGMFTTTYDETNARKAIFFGGGSGITPLFSLIKSILLKEKESHVTLVYGNRTEDFIIFKDELNELADTYDNFQLHHILEEDKQGIASYHGRPDAEMIKQILSDLGADNETEIYICGPQPMMDVVQEGIQKTGLSDDRVRVESFEAGKTSPSEIIAEEEHEEGSGNAEVTIVLDGETHSISIEKSRPILEQGLEQGLDMPYSCQSGLCTACRGKCLEGEVSVDKVEGLTQEELDEGYVLTCVGQALSDKVEIEIG